MKLRLELFQLQSEKKKKKNGGGGEEEKRRKKMGFFKFNFTFSLISLDKLILFLIFFNHLTNKMPYVQREK